MMRSINARVNQYAADSDEDKDDQHSLAIRRYIDPDNVIIDEDNVDETYEYGASTNEGEEELEIEEFDPNEGQQLEERRDLDLNRFNLEASNSYLPLNSAATIYKGANCGTIRMDRVLKSVENLPSAYRPIFSRFPYFNYVQSAVFDDIIYTNRNMVISAPTSSGKTVVLELAIVNLLASLNITRQHGNIGEQEINTTTRLKIIYMAPLKALCSEKIAEWREKFEPYGLKCAELTGDSELDVESKIGEANIICTTPEKWDTVSRKLHNRRSIMSDVRLFLIDEIHVLGEASRGAVVEAVVSRMKMLAISSTNRTGGGQEAESNIRFIAVSATIPNIDDFANWLGTRTSTDAIKPALVYKISEDFRPVQLKKVVLGYNCGPKTSDFRFDMSLNYKLAQVIKQYSNGKPTLVFCTTRKTCQQAAQTLAKENNLYIRDKEHSSALKDCATRLQDTKLAELVARHGLGYHHAGLANNDRRLIESLFLNGNLHVLLSTSTLSIGVNLPAHLVIIKSTMCYTPESGSTEYSTSQILQMMGRAGRPQFDRTATAVIMTKMNDKDKYENLVTGNQIIESQLHKNLIEHLNAEIVMETIVDVQTSINWLKSTYFYTRLKINPSYYGIDVKKHPSDRKLTDAQIDSYLTQLCHSNLNSLAIISLVDLDVELPTASRKTTTTISSVKPTRTGQLMARYCLAYETMKSLVALVDDASSGQNDEEGQESKMSLLDLIRLVSSCKELEDIKLRMNEKAVLNALNNQGKTVKAASNAAVIRYILDGRVKTHDMKINILIQAQFGSITITEFSLIQDTLRIFRIAQRISSCLLEYLFQQYIKSTAASKTKLNNFETFMNGAMLHKCITCRLWHDSPHILKQFARIGDSISLHFVQAQVTTFVQVERMDARLIESIAKKHAPFGTVLLETVQKLPKFAIRFERDNGYAGNSRAAGLVKVRFCLENLAKLIENGDGGTLGTKYNIVIVVGDENNNLLVFEKIGYKSFLDNRGEILKSLNLNASRNGGSIHASLVLLPLVGLDVHKSFEWRSANDLDVDMLEPKNDAPKIKPEINKRLSNSVGKNPQQQQQSAKLVPIKPANLKRKESSCSNRVVVDNKRAKLNENIIGEKADEKFEKHDTSVWSRVSALDYSNFDPDKFDDEVAVFSKGKKPPVGNLTFSSSSSSFDDFVSHPTNKATSNYQQQSRLMPPPQETQLRIAENYKKTAVRPALIPETIMSQTSVDTTDRKFTFKRPNNDQQQQQMRESKSYDKYLQPKQTNVAQNDKTNSSSSYFASSISKPPPLKPKSTTTLNSFQYKSQNSYAKQQTSKNDLNIITAFDNIDYDDEEDYLSEQEEYNLQPVFSFAKPNDKIINQGNLRFKEDERNLSSIFPNNTTFSDSGVYSCSSNNITAQTQTFSPMTNQKAVKNRPSIINDYSTMSRSSLIGDKTTTKKTQNDTKKMSLFSQDLGGYGLDIDDGDKENSADYFNDFSSSRHMFQVQSLLPTEYENDVLLGRMEPSNSQAATKSSNYKYLPDNISTPKKQSFSVNRAKIPMISPSKSSPIKTNPYYSPPVQRQTRIEDFFAAQKPSSKFAYFTNQQDDKEAQKTVVKKPAAVKQSKSEDKNNDLDTEYLNWMKSQSENREKVQKTAPNDNSSEPSYSPLEEVDKEVLLTNSNQMNAKKLYHLIEDL